MTMLRKIAALTVVAATLAGTAGQALAGSAPIWIANTVKGRAAWVSISTTAWGSNTLQRLCVLPGTTVKSNPIDLMRYTNVYLRAEFKDYGNGCLTHHNRFDINSTIITPNANGRSQMTYSGDNIDQQPSVNNTGWH